LCGFNGAAAVVVGDISVLEERVGLFNRGNAGQAELFDQAVLVGEKPAFDTALGLRGVGAKDLDIQVVHGAGELGDGLIITEFFFNGGLAVDLVDGVFIDIKSGGSSPAEEVSARGGEEFQGILNGDEFAVEYAAGGIVYEDQEDAAGPTALEPVMIGAIQLNELAQGGAAFPPGSVLGGKSPGFVKRFTDHPLTQGKGRKMNSMIFREFFIGEGGAKVSVAHFNDIQGTIEEAGVQLVVGRLPPKAVNDARVALPANVSAQAPYLALREVQLSGGFRPGHLLLQNLVNRF